MSNSEFIFISVLKDICVSMKFDIQDIYVHYLIHRLSVNDFPDCLLQFAPHRLQLTDDNLLFVCEAIKGLYKVENMNELFTHIIASIPVYPHYELNIGDIRTYVSFSPDGKSCGGYFYFQLGDSESKKRIDIRMKKNNHSYYYTYIIAQLNMERMSLRGKVF
eukprot:TRINITY_DN888_c0_g1_i1.p1 TRINITY_DN888_c0_g1~~TRINITY_DN888_c0_g1_i1.p1  ORF type:complete len:162 (+),score=19.01 TRINITY_DN888_c0_g1_i1:92-577(+)